MEGETGRERKNREILMLVGRLVELGYAEERTYAGELTGYDVWVPTRWGRIHFSVDTAGGDVRISEAWILLPEGTHYLVTDNPEQLVKAMRLLVEGKKDQIDKLFRENLEPLDKQN